HVDPAGRHQQAGCIDLAPSRAKFAADLDEALARDRQIAGERRLAGTIDDGAAANDDVVHRSLLKLGKKNDAPSASAMQCERLCVAGTAAIRFGTYLSRIPAAPGQSIIPGLGPAFAGKRAEISFKEPGDAQDTRLLRRQDD